MTQTSPIFISTHLTLEDYAEGSVAVTRAAVKRQVQQASEATIVPTLTFVAGAFAMIGAERYLDPMRAERPPAYEFLAFGLPLLVHSIATTFVVRFHARRSDAADRSWRAGLAWLRAIAPWIIIAAVGGLTATAVYRTGAARGADWFGALYPHAMWLLVAALDTWTAARAVRPQLRQAWEAQPSLRRPFTAEISDASVRFREGDLVTRTYAWDAFVRWLETDHAVILCPNELSFETLPKRSFASDEDVATLRSLCERLIVDPAKRLIAFPVVQVAGQSSPVAPTQPSDPT